MFVNKDHPMSYADVWPWANTKEEARNQKRITITDEGQVVYEGRKWTKQEFIEYMGALFRAFVEAFILAAEAKAKLEARKLMARGNREA